VVERAVEDDADRAVGVDLEAELAVVALTVRQRPGDLAAFGIGGGKQADGRSGPCRFQDRRVRQRDIGRRGLVFDRRLLLCLEYSMVFNVS
jgi:hypothetical protein